MSCGIAIISLAIFEAAGGSRGGEGGLLDEGAAPVDSSCRQAGRGRGVIIERLSKQPGFS